MKKFISIFLLLYITLPINAQDKTNELSGFIIHKQENGSNGSLDGANIFLIYAKDTLKTTSINGVFRFKPIKTGKAKLIITAIGCRKVEKELNIIAGKNSNLYIEILDESIQLEEVTIKGRIPIVTQNGDTLIFNPKAVNVQEGDVAMNIVEQLPGTETDDHSVKIMGKQVTKTYIDGRLIFGSDPMAALKNLSATDVLKIKAYDEYENTKTKKLMYRGDLTRVLNIETKSKPSAHGRHTYWLVQAATWTQRTTEESSVKGSDSPLTFSPRNFYSQVMYFTIISTENQIISKMFFPFPILVVLTTKQLMQIWLRNAHGTQKMEHTVHLEHFTLSDIIAIIQIHDPNNIIFLATIISSAFMKNKIATVTENKITIPNFLSPIQMTNGENSVGTSL